MALSHVTKIFAVKEMKIAKLLTDPSGAPPATYGTSVPLTGAQKLTITGTVNTKFLRGDNRLLDSDAVLDSIKGVVDYAKVSADALAILFSTAAVDSGSTPNQLTTWQMASTDTMNYFKIEGRAASADLPASGTASDVLFSLWKCKIDIFPPLGLMEEDYQRSNFSFTALPRLADNYWLNVVVRETAVALT